MNQEQFDETYYLFGKEKGISNYEQYRWLPGLTIPMAKMVGTVLDVRKKRILDFGCARGYLVKALRHLGYNAHGYDISKWAIENCDPAVERYVFNNLFGNFDIVFCKDVLEHIPEKELTATLLSIFSFCEKAMFIVPLAEKENGAYIYPNDELDKTHIHRKTFQGWLDLLTAHAPEFMVAGSKHIPLLKQSNENFPGSAGFFYCKKLKGV